MTAAAAAALVAVDDDAIHIVKFIGFVVARKTIYEFKSIFERHTRTASDRAAKQNMAKTSTRSLVHSFGRPLALCLIAVRSNLMACCMYEGQC